MSADKTIKLIKEKDIEYPNIYNSIDNKHIKYYGDSRTRFIALKSIFGATYSCATIGTFWKKLNVKGVVLTLMPSQLTILISSLGYSNDEQNVDIVETQCVDFSDESVGEFVLSYTPYVTKGADVNPQLIIVSPEDVKHITKKNRLDICFIIVLLIVFIIVGLIYVCVKNIKMFHVV